MRSGRTSRSGDGMRDLKNIPLADLRIEKDRVEAVIRKTFNNCLRRDYLKYLKRIRMELKRRTAV